MTPCSCAASSHSGIQSRSGFARSTTHLATNKYELQPIDLNEQLIVNKSATFLMRVTGNAMVGSGIFEGDTLVVDRSITAVNGRVVIAVLNGKRIIRRLEKINNKVRLIPASDLLSPIEVDPGATEFSIWGVVIYNIHAFTG